MSDYKQTRSAAGDVTSQYGQMLRNLDDDLVKRLGHGDTVMANHYMDEAADRIEELEAKLAKTVKRLEKLSRWLDLDDEELANLPIETLAEDHRHIQQQVNAAIAELKGQDL